MISYIVKYVGTFTSACFSSKTPVCCLVFLGLFSEQDTLGASLSSPGLALRSSHTEKSAEIWSNIRILRVRSGVRKPPVFLHVRALACWEVDISGDKTRRRTDRCELHWRPWDWPHWSQPPSLWNISVSDFQTQRRTKTRHCSPRQPGRWPGTLRERRPPPLSQPPHCCSTGTPQCLRS